VSVRCGGTEGPSVGGEGHRVMSSAQRESAAQLDPRSDLIRDVGREGWREEGREGKGFVFRWMLVMGDLNFRWQPRSLNRRYRGCIWNYDDEIFNNQAPITNGSMEILTSRLSCNVFGEQMRDLTATFRFVTLRCHGYACSNYSSEAPDLIQPVRIGILTCTVNLRGTSLRRPSSRMMLQRLVFPKVKRHWCDACGPGVTVSVHKIRHSFIAIRRYNRMPRGSPVKAYRAKCDGQSRSIDRIAMASSLRSRPLDRHRPP